MVEGLALRKPSTNGVDDCCLAQMQRLRTRETGSLFTVKQLLSDRTRVWEFQTPRATDLKAYLGLFRVRLGEPDLMGDYFWEDSLGMG